MFRSAALFLLAGLCLSAQVTVPVVVRDRDGRAVAGLHQTDFQLFDKGSPREITGFSAVEAPAGPGTSAWLIDDMRIDLGALTRLRLAAMRHLATLPAGERIGIFTTSCRVAQESTADRDKLRDALLRIEYSPNLACREPELPALIERLAAAPGRHDILLISPGLPLSPEEVSDLIDQAVRARTVISAMRMKADFAMGTTGELAYGTGGAYAGEGAFRDLVLPANRYMLTFAAAGDGGIHPLRLEVRGSRKLRAQLRDYYFVKVAAPAEAAVKKRERVRLADALRKPEPVVAAAPEQAVVAAVKPEAPAVPAKPAEPAKPKGPPLLAIMTVGQFGTYDPFAAPIDETEITWRDEPLGFERGSNLMLVPVVVRDPGGHTIATLRRQDFQVADNGETREIARFTVRKAGTAARYIGYLFDDLHLSAADLTKTGEGARRQIAALAAHDRVGIYTTSGTNAPMDFSGDRAKISAALANLRPAANDSDFSGVPVARDVIRRMARLPGWRDLILVSPVLQPDQSGLLDRAVFADVFLSADPEAALPDCVYTLGIARGKVKPDGSVHTFQIAVREVANASVLAARSGYTAPKPGTAQEIESAVLSRAQIRDLPVAVSTQYQRDGDQARLTVSATMDVRHMAFRKSDGINADDVTVVSSLFDHDGNFLAGAQKVVQFRVKDRTRRILEGGLPVTVRTVFDLKPGDYVVRLVARDTEGRQIGAQSSAVAIR